MTINYTTGHEPLSRYYPGAFHIQFNDFLMRTQALMRCSNTTTTAPPSSPAFGACYIIAPFATGAWTDSDNFIVVWYGNDWVYITPRAGMRLYNSARDCFVEYTEDQVWFHQEAAFNAGNKSSGTWTLTEFINYGLVYAAFNSSGITVTLGPSTANFSLGRTYTLFMTNTTGGNCTLALASSTWIAPASSFPITMATGSRRAIHFIKEPGGRLYIAHVSSPTYI